MVERRTVIDPCVTNLIFMLPPSRQVKECNGEHAQEDLSHKDPTDEDSIDVNGQIKTTT